MKHKTLRTLLCVILTVCFCLSAIAPVSAAGLFSGDTGAANIFDEWIRSLKDRFMEKNPGTDETPADPMAGTGEEFIRIFHLDCGRRYFSIAEIKGIIDTLEAKKYTHIELAFGNDGLRFLLDDMSVTANGKEYSNADVTAAIQAGNREYYSNGQNELSEADMNTIIAYANEHHISVIPLINMPGHSNALITAMAQLFGVNRNSLYTYENSNGGQAFKVVDNEKAVAFATALAKKYVDYFSVKGSEYFNIGADECGYTESVSDNYPFEQTIASDLLIPMAEYIIGNGMKPMMFNDGFNTNGALQNALTANTYGNQFTICYWDYSKRTTADDLNQAGFGIINTHNKWYYVAGNEGENSDDSNWFGYGWAKNNLNGEYKNCSVCDSDFTQPNGCMLAYWCDKPTDAKDPKLDRVKELIRILSDNNTKKFTGNLSMPAKPAISGVPSSVQISDGTLNVSSSIAARWTSSNNSVITFEDAATNAAADSASYTETATARIVGAGTAIITATTANRGWSVQTVTVTNNGGTTTPSAKTITVTVGGTSTDTINGQYDGTQENEFAKVVAESREVAGETTYTKKGLPIAGESAKYYISSNKNDSSPKIEITIEVDGYNNYYLKNENGQYIYPARTSSGNILQTSDTKISVGITGDTNNGFTVSYSGHYYTMRGNYRAYTAYLTISNGTLSSNYSSQNLYLYEGKPTPAGYETVVTVTGKKVTTAPVEMIVGTVKYLITVTAENLSSVTPLPIQLWITNNTIEGSGTNAKTTGSGWGGDNSLGTARYISVPATTANATSSVYSEAGMLVVDAFTAAGMTEPLTRYEWGGTRFITARDDKAAQDLVFWTGRIHNSTDSNIQNVWGADYSNSGSAFNYVRYYGGEWAVSADGKTGWTTVTGAGSTGHYYNCTQQLAAYYMTRTAITEEVTTDVADWGKPKDGGEYDSQVSSDFVLLDFAVKYEDGTQRPGKDDFPVSGKTLAYHCETDNAAVGTQNGVKYRMLNNFRAVNTTEYEVYKVTVTMTSGSASTQLTAYAAKNGYTYDSTTEQIVWAIDEAARDASGLEEYTSISGSTTYSGCKIGGTPDVRGVEVYNKHGALITYYVRAKANPDSLTVNYFVEDATDPFYHYNINVDTSKPESTFKEGIALNAANWKGKLDNGDVVNIKGQRQWVSADLGSMPEIGAQYRFSNYTCVRVDRVSEKIVNLYYKFEAKASFVVDFGLPIIITPADLNADLATSANITGAIVSDTSYATVKTDGKNIIYTLKKPLDSVDTFTIQYVGKNLTTEKEGDATYDIKIFPATNVYYEENFITNPENSGWTNTATADSVEQTLEKSGKKQNVYGYDTKVENYYLGNPDGGKGITYSMGNALTTTLSIPAGAKEAITEKPLTFSFKGTGFDLISKCSDKTGILLVYIKGTKLNANGKPYQGVFLVDTYFAGDNAPEGGTAIMAKGTTVYQVPVVREFGAFNKKYDDTLTENAGLPYDTYQVSVYAYLNNNAGVFDNNAATVASYSAVSVSDSSIIADALAACNITDIDAGQVKLVYMDENIILNGGTGAVAEQSAVSMASLYTATVDSAEVYVDAFRVYNPLGDTTVQISNEKFNPAEKNEVQTYKDDKESGVKYMSLYDFVVGNLGSYGNEADGTSSSVYVEYDGNKPAEEQIVGKEYKVHGPQNEIYLAKGCGIAFHINELSDGQTIQISAKAVDGLPTFNGSDVTATEMYYDLTSMTNALTGTGTGKDVVIYNNGDGVLAISGLKCSATITITANSSATQAAINTIRYAMSAKDASYAPATFEITAPETARRNRSIGIGVTATATDVDSMKIQVMCDGVVVSEETTLYPYNVKAVEQGKATNYYYSKSYRFTKAGTYVFTATAFDGNDNSYSIEKTVVVK